MANRNVKPTPLAVRWLPGARKAYTQSILYIAGQDQQAALLVAQRVEKALQLIAAQPGIGTPIRSARRRYPVPKTGHFLDYYVSNNEIRITRWARQTRRP